ncbi:Protein kinase-like (PK-like) [Glarea lozoyensis ATCC 20868]|uniref:Protein kinase-like (PK-like) n=1 Tax=Glarea lozoyensis (strain ATCC 20868 / MF5171) TaxID=1116229 RepID=S3D5C2_GLAL2|nr:Protein kinase-like (PK-like) [Glarea lozoyensis ATCC 20868]EPE32980.1 Protein kinase-like (PK-like) [Glarea lozoyensis ATCC 20868]
MILSSEKLWESVTGGVVLKCNAKLVAKIIRVNDDYTEYTTLQYLATHAADLPVPKPHGLVRFGSARIMFMTYFPNMTLEAAWSGLTIENKVGIQVQLDGIFTKLRTLKGEGRFGGVNGEGVRDDHREDHTSQAIITTIAEFEDFQFSIPPYSRMPWIMFLRSLLPSASSGTVFTHGDVRTANIMVDRDESGDYFVTGVIDWETSEFYPEYFESSKILYLFNVHDQSDWWRYIPECIAPAKHPERWLVGRLWNQCVTRD